MRAYSTNRNKPDPTNSVFIGAASRASEAKSASIHLLNSPTKPGQHRGSVRGTQIPPTLQTQMADFLADVEGLPAGVRLLVKELLVEMQSSFVSKGADIHTLLSSTLASMADRIRGSSLQNTYLSEQSSVSGELISSSERLGTLSAPRNETVLRVGPLELDLIERSAKRCDRQISLRPREFQLLR
ncbi:MAG: DNA-binding response regulator [Bradyrhizobium sp.]|nr:DNA-binding response regulator [Bradyrhizobium sp.]